MKYNIDAVEVSLINKETGENILKNNTLLSTSSFCNYELIPWTFSIRNTEDNEDFFNKALLHVGKTLRVETDSFNGLFNLSLESNEIVFTEVM